jgi:DNA mismatch repair ATPase MutS
MKALLLYPDRDFNLDAAPPEHAQALIQDLELETLLDAMASGDAFLLEVAKKVLLAGVGDLETIRYRQGIMRDCLRHSSIVVEVYNIAVEAIAKEKKEYWSLFSRYPGAILSRAVNVLQMFVGMLKKLRRLADEHADKFESEGFTTLFAMLRKELDDDYFAAIDEHLRQLQFRDGVLLSAELGKGNKGRNYVLRKSKEPRQSWIGRRLWPMARGFTFHIHPRDESGARALSELRDQGVNLVANALAQSTDHILGFFTMLRIELAFYVACLNLNRQLAEKGMSVSFPVPAPPEERRHSGRGLYDVCLALTMERRVVANDLEADGKDLVIVTGPNQGGKSTFLRSIGLAQIMMQCGMFVPAESFHANICVCLFTHYKREEDATMKSGKFDEELARMSEIVDRTEPNAMVLFNESFAATNEREGAEIANQIVSALLDEGIKIFFVTHLFEFARGLHDKKMKNALFLRAERQADGQRTFKIVEGEPLPTSYGKDLYDRIFKTASYA